MTAHITSDSSPCTSRSCALSLAPRGPLYSGMILLMFFRLFFAASAVLMLALPAFAQTGNVAILPDLRLFTTMAALNAAGFDIEFGSQYHPVREAVRHYADNLDPELLAQLRTFYKS